MRDGIRAVRRSQLLLVVVSLIVLATSLSLGELGRTEAALEELSLAGRIDFWRLLWKAKRPSLAEWAASLEIETEPWGTAPAVLVWHPPATVREIRDFLRGPRSLAGLLLVPVIEDPAQVLEIREAAEGGILRGVYLRYGFRRPYGPVTAIPSEDSFLSEDGLDSVERSIASRCSLLLYFEGRETVSIPVKGMKFTRIPLHIPSPAVRRWQADYMDLYARGRRWRDARKTPLPAASTRMHEIGDLLPGEAVRYLKDREGGTLLRFEFASAGTNHQLRLLIAALGVVLAQLYALAHLRRLRRLSTDDVDSPVSWIGAYPWVDAIIVNVVASFVLPVGAVVGLAAASESEVAVLQVPGLMPVFTVLGVVAMISVVLLSSLSLREARRIRETERTRQAAG